MKTVFRYPKIYRIIHGTFGAVLIIGLSVLLFIDGGILDAVNTLPNPAQKTISYLFLSSIFLVFTITTLLPFFCYVVVADDNFYIKRFIFNKTYMFADIQSIDSIRSFKVLDGEIIPRTLYKKDGTIHGLYWKYEKPEEFIELLRERGVDIVTLKQEQKLGKKGY